MPVTAYFGDRYKTFLDAAKNLENIFETPDLPPGFPADIVVIDKAPPQSALLPVGTVGVVMSHNTEGLKCLMRSGVKTVVCGMSHRDTVTLSSSFPEATVCLQRRLPALGKRIFEPAEYRIKGACDNPEYLMLASAVSLLCGREPT